MDKVSNIKTAIASSLDANNSPATALKENASAVKASSVKEGSRTKLPHHYKISRLFHKAAETLKTNEEKVRAAVGNQQQA